MSKSMRHRYPWPEHSSPGWSAGVKLQRFNVHLVLGVSFPSAFRHLDLKFFLFFIQLYNGFVVCMRQLSKLLLERYQCPKYGHSNFIVRP